MKKSLLAVTLIAALFSSSVMAADNNTPTGPDFGKLRESAAAPFRLLGNLIGGNKAEAATAQPDQSAQSDESTIAVTSFGGMKVEYRPNSQWITVTHACEPNNCGYWDARVWLKKKGVTVAVDIELTADGHDLVSSGFGVLAPAQAPECDPCVLPSGVVLTPGEYLIQVSPFVSYKKELEHQKVRASGLIRLGVLTVTKNSITARSTLGNLNEAEFLGKKLKNGTQFN